MAPREHGGKKPVMRLCLRKFTLSFYFQTTVGVVDSSLRVYGTKNVRVVDASVFPLHIAANTQASVYAVAEKVSGALPFIPTLAEHLTLLGCSDDTRGIEMRLACFTALQFAYSSSNFRYLSLSPRRTT
jgi:GMC oxidoreductase